MTLAGFYLLRNKNKPTERSKESTKRKHQKKAPKGKNQGKNQGKQQVRTKYRNFVQHAKDYATMHTMQAKQGKQRSIDKASKKTKLLATMQKLCYNANHASNQASID